MFNQLEASMFNHKQGKQAITYAMFLSASLIFNWLATPSLARAESPSPVQTKSADPSSDIGPLTAPDKTLPITNTGYFGMIEIGGKGVKAIAVDMGYAEHTPSCQASEDAFGECVRKSILKEFKTKNVNPIDQASIQDTVKAARSFMVEMTTVLNVDARHVYLVGSSSIDKVAHKTELQTELERMLGKPGEMRFIKESEEGELSFRGVLNLIPEKWREMRRLQAALIDIGSGNTTGGYMDSNKNFIPVSIPFGTKSFTEEVDKAKGDRSFPQTAAELRKTLIQPKIHEEITRKQGLKNHGRMYLIGGIAWATKSITHPDSNPPFTRLYPKDFDSLYRLSTDTKAFYDLCANTSKNHATDDLKKVCDTFTKENLVAGIEILRAFANEMDFSHKHVFFIRDSLYAWSLGYIRSRCQNEHSC